MNKRHYEHTLPNIRGSLSNTYECGGTDIDILSDEGVAVCNDCCLEWPYAED